jgi:hypothetical protein
MIDGGLDYNKTLETNKIVFKGQTYQKVISFIFIVIMVSWAFGVSYYIFKNLTKNNPSLIVYFIALFLSIIIFTLIGFEVRTLLTRDRLKEIEINIGISEAKAKLLEAAKNINWELYSNLDHYLVLRTENEFFSDCQNITLIFFPNNRIYFHSINFPNDYIRLSWFNTNYEKLLNEYQRIEKV